MSHAEELRKRGLFALFAEGVAFIQPEEPLPNDDTHRLTVAYEDGSAVMVTFRDLSDQDVQKSWTDEYWTARGMNPPPPTPTVDGGELPDDKFEEIFGIKLDKPAEEE